MNLKSTGLALGMALPLMFLAGEEARGQDWGFYFSWQGGGRHVHRGGHAYGGYVAVHGPAFGSGYRDGYRHGRRDGRRGYTFSYHHGSDYRRALRGYHRRHGSRTSYQFYYRRGYSEGYGAGFYSYGPSHHPRRRGPY